MCASIRFATPAVQKMNSFLVSLILVSYSAKISVLQFEGESLGLCFTQGFAPSLDS